MFSNIRNEERTFRNLINGEWIGSEEYIDIKSPIDGSLVGKVPRLSKGEIDVAIKGCKNAKYEWKCKSNIERANVLYKWSDILLERIEELTDILIREIGKDKNSAKAEIERTADFIKYTADISKSISGESILGDNFPGYKKNKISVVTREPLGIVLAISPFNYPINLAASKIAPAIVAGNTVLFKPATQGSLCGLYLAKTLEMAGIPKGVLNTITGKGSEIGDYVVTHPDIDFINFTGSTEVGIRISEITKMIPVLMELGGKDAAIVLEDANLELAAKNIVAGAYSYSGQRCTAVKRILVIDKIADKLVEKLKNEIEKLMVASSVEVDFDIGPLIDSKAADFVWDLIDDAREKGAHLVCGGKRQGNIIYPTLFDYVREDMRLAWEEPFGPVLPIIRVESIEEAIKIANKSQYGLQSCVFTDNINNAFQIANSLEVGTVQINNKTERGPDHFPFLGVKASGLGTQGVRYSIESMSRPKAIVINIY